MKSHIASLLITALCLLSFPAAAQQTGPQSKQGTISDDDFITLQQQIKELKNPTFRAFLRMRILSWESPQLSSTRREAALELATQGVKDLCEHKDEVWTPTASWFHEKFVEQIKSLQSPTETTLESCVLTNDTKNKSAKDFSSAMKMLKNPETSAAGLSLAKTAILSGQISGHGLLGQLHFLQTTGSPHVSELLDAVLSLEENRPGTLTLDVLPFFTSLFLAQSVQTEVQTRFLFVAVRASRRSKEELDTIPVRAQVRQLLNGIIIAAKQFTPALYPEIASRLNSIDRTPNIIEMRLAAEERITKASDQLEQLISEANSASNEQTSKHFFFRAANLTKEQGQLSKAVDLAMKVVNDNERTREQNQPTWLNDFLSEIVSLAVKKNSPSNATYAISKMTNPLGRVNSFRLLGDYYGANEDKAKSKEAFVQATKQLKSVENGVGKVRSYLVLAESVLKYEPADAYEIFRESLKAINDLPSPQKDQEKMYYVHLMPVAEDLIRSFRLLATRQNENATGLAAEIKLSELRVSALSGIYSSH